MLCIAGGTAHDQRHRYFRDFRRHIDGDAVVAGAVDGAQQRPDGQISDAPHIHAHGRERRGDHGGKDEIVKTGDACLLRHIDALTLQFGERPKRMQVGNGGKGSETICHQIGKPEPAAGTISLFDAVDPKRPGHTGLAETIANAAETVILHVGIAVLAHQHHLAVAKACQIVAHLPAAIPMVGGDGVSGRRRAVDDGDRAIDAGDARAAAGNDDHAVHSALDQPVDGIRLHGDLAASIGNQHAITGRDCCFFDGLCDLWEKRVGDIGQDEPQNA